MHRQPYLAEHCWLHTETLQLPNCYCACIPISTTFDAYCFNKKNICITSVLFISSFNSSIKQWNQKLYIILLGVLYQCYYICVFHSHGFSLLVNNKLPKAERVVMSFSLSDALSLTSSFNDAHISLLVLYNTVRCKIKSDPQ